MKAELQPLQGKYSGTIVTLTDDTGLSFDVKVWCSPSTPEYPPSTREMEDWVPEEDGTMEQFARDLMCQPHYESTEALKIARLIVTAVNDLPELLAENRRLREALQAKQEDKTITPFGRSVLEGLKPEKNT